QYTDIITTVRRRRPRNRRTARGVAEPKPCFKAASFVKAMHARIGAAALQQHVMTILFPGVGQCGENDGPAMASAAKFGMRHDIFEKAMLAAGAHKISRRDQPAGRPDPRVDVGYEPHNAI